MNRWKKKQGDVHLMNGPVTLCDIPMLGNNYAIENEKITCKKCNELRTEQLMKGIELIKSGYAGVMPNGNIVDRREFPNAIPCQENELFGTPKPKKV